MTDGTSADRRIVPLVRPAASPATAGAPARHRLGAQHRRVKAATRLGLTARSRSFDTPPAPDEKSMPVWPYLALLAVTGAILAVY